ncbi:MAG: Threonine dehydrogenase, partial [Myxococcaceae bacterium]|nr:Threonine dehydrogenase [Myxococcaceae bacterium]
MSARVITEWQVGFGVPGGLPVAVTLGLLLLVVAVLGSRVRQLSLGRGLALVLLRWLSALSAFVLATQPTFWAEQKRTEEGQLAVVLDVSRSMGVTTDGHTRSDRLQALVARWRGEKRASQVRWFVLGDTLDPVELSALSQPGSTSLAPVAAATALLPRLSELARTDELGAVVLVSDGADTSGLSLPKQLGTRVHTVLVPDQRALRDDAIAEVRADQVAFLHGEAKVHASIASMGLGERDLIVTLSRAGKPLTTRAVHVAAGATQALELSFTPQDLGREVYSLRVEVDAEDDVPEINERSF